jgi:hypothetical protein
MCNITNRPSIPRSLERAVLIEAGHRCAIPTCRQTPVEIAHIQPYSEVHEHSFENLIALCPTCHTRYDHHEIDRKSMLLYKANLSILNSRYGDFEKRILNIFAEQPDRNEIELPFGFEILAMYLIQDGIIEFNGKTSVLIVQDNPSWKCYTLTEKGRDLIRKLKSAEKIE